MNATYKYNRLSKDEAAVLLVDHQSGLGNALLVMLSEGS